MKSLKKIISDFWLTIFSYASPLLLTLMVLTIQFSSANAKHVHDGTLHHTNVRCAQSFPIMASFVTGGLSNKRVISEVPIKPSLLPSKQSETTSNRTMILCYQDQQNIDKIEQLRQETFKGKVIIALLIVSMITIFIIVILSVRSLKLYYKSKSKELEMIALHSQMNPHFIFNCLNSINLFIVKSDPIEATNYLTKFAKLIRSMLDNSKHSLIPIEQEISTISLYLELEAMRFKNKFSYSISIDEALDVESVKIAPMIIQPFIENAIWHGLNHLTHKGNIAISLELKDQYLICTILDNGVGRKKALEYQSEFANQKLKSYGIQITRERLELLSKKGLKSFLNITDLTDDQNNSIGTKVQIGIPVPD